MRINHQLRGEMAQMGESTYPNEGCGILIGRPGPDVEVVEVLKGTNLRNDRARDRYVLDPLEVVRAEKRAQARGLDVVGFWHTHPDHPARPSQYDADHAWPEYVYVIMAIHQGKHVDVTAWVLEEGELPRFRPEEMGS
ncbi:MAG: M67 family metallopeptidase [Candidatus Dormibacteria bacterium]